jgi:hypothetical protein
VGEIPGAIAWPTACQASTGWDEFPKYFAPQLVHAMSRQLRTKVLFGTDYPYIKMDRSPRLRGPGYRPGGGAADLQGQRTAGAGVTS